MGLDFDDAVREGAVGLLQDAGQSDQVPELGGVTFMDNDGSGGGDFRAGKNFGEKYLIGAQKNGVGVVDDDEAFGLGPAGEPVGVVIDVGGFANKQGVEFGKAAVVVAGDEFDAEGMLFGGAAELCFEVVPRKKAKELIERVLSYCPNAFVTVEDVRASVHGSDTFTAEASKLPTWRRLIKWK